MKGEWDSNISDVLCLLPPATRTLVFPLQLTETTITQMNGRNSKTFLSVYNSTEVQCTYDNSESYIQIKQFEFICEH
jgi:hypothetical protein